MFLLRSLLIAFSMYSRIPVPIVEWKQENMKYAIAWLPAVGAVIGALMWEWSLLAGLAGVTPVLFGAVATALPLVVSGGFHLDGFCDTVDALSSHAEKERKLEILKDSHVGAFAVMGCGVYLLLTFALWAELGAGSPYVVPLCVGFVASRSLAGLAAVTFRGAKKTGLLALFSGAAEKRTARAMLALWTAAAIVCWAVQSVPAALCLSAAAGLASLYYRVMSYRQFGGVTGDLSGFFVQICELSMLAAAVILQKGMEVSGCI